MTNSSRVTNRRSLVDIFLVVEVNAAAVEEFSPGWVPAMKILALFDDSKGSGILTLSK